MASTINGAGPVSAATEIEAQKLLGTGERREPSSTFPNLHAIRADLIGSDTCTALGLTCNSGSPVLALCRDLVTAGHDQASRLDVYRGDVLCLRIRSISECAELEINGKG